MTTTIEQTIEVQVPIETAYNQWTQFEEFPRFMEGVRKSGSSMTAGCTGSPSSAASGMSGLRRLSSSTRRSVSPGAIPTAKTMPAW